MFLYFSDWTRAARLETLRQRGAPLGGRLVKVYASPVDPSLVLGRRVKTLIYEDGEFKGSELFAFGDRGRFGGLQLEEDLNELALSEYGKKFVRSLFRFGTNPEIGCINYGMEARKNGVWVFNHPFEPIHGIAEASARPMSRAPAIHLDIFSPRTLGLLRRFVDFEDENQLIGEKEAAQVVREVRPIAESSVLREKER